MAAGTMIRHHYNLALGRHKAGETTDLAIKAAEAGLIGAGLGFISAQSKTGLDVGIGTMKIPLDMAMGAAFLGGSMFLPLDRATREVVERMGATAIGIGVFRKTEDYVKSRVSLAHGELDAGADDPILAAARNL